MSLPSGCSSVSFKIPFVVNGKHESVSPYGKLIELTEGLVGTPVESQSEDLGPLLTKWGQSMGLSEHSSLGSTSRRVLPPIR
jgi:hypothetical protein